MLWYQIFGEGAPERRRRRRRRGGVGGVIVLTWLFHLGTMGIATQQMEMNRTEKNEWDGWVSQGRNRNGFRNCKERFSYLNFEIVGMVGIVTLFGGVGKIGAVLPGLGHWGTHHGADKKNKIIIRSIDLGNSFLG